MKKSPEEQLQILLDKQKQTYKKVGPAVLKSTLGDTVLTLLDAGEEISLENIKNSIRQQIEQTSSAKGKTDQDLDVTRIALEAVLTRIDSKHQ